MAKSVYWKEHDKVEKAFRKSVEFKQLSYIGLGAFEDLQSGGMEARVKANQSEWKPLNKYYLNRKIKQGHQREPYRRTGKLAKSLNWMPKGVGKAKGVKYSITKNYNARLEYDLRVKGKKHKRAFGRLNYMRPLIYWENNDGSKMTPYIAKRIEYVFSKEGLASINSFKAGR